MINNVEVLTREEVLTRHLQCHTIPIDTCFVSACKVSIDLINAGKKDVLVAMPEGYSFYNTELHKKEKVIPAFKFAIMFHLDEFLIDQDAWEEFLYS